MNQQSENVKLIWIESKFQSRCLRCNRTINKTEKILFVIPPQSKKVLCQECGRIEFDRFEEQKRKAIENPCEYCDCTKGSFDCDDCIHDEIPF